jgi:hypothetical protein
VRRLVFHPESDSLFEIKTEIEWESCAEQGCDDVTDDETFETLFREKLLEEEKKAAKEMPPLRTS